MKNVCEVSTGEDSRFSIIFRGGEVYSCLIYRNLKKIGMTFVSLQVDFFALLLLQQQ